MRQDVDALTRKVKALQKADVGKLVRARIMEFDAAGRKPIRE